MAEKMRVHILAKQLNVSSKAILLKCAAEGLPVKNHMTALGPGLEATIREWFTDGAHVTTIETAERVNLEKVRVRKTRKQKTTAVATESTGPGDEQAAGGIAVQTEAVAAVAEPPLEQADVVSTTVADGAIVEGTVPPAETVEEPQPPATTDRLVAEATPAPPGDEPTPTETEALPEAPADQPAATPPAPPAPVIPAGPQNVPAPAKLQGPRVVRYETPDRDYRAPPRRRPGPPAPGASGPPSVPSEAGSERGDQRRRPGDAKRRGRGTTASPRRTLNRGSETGAAEKLREWRDQDLLEQQERLAGATGRRVHRRRAMEAKGGEALQGGPAQRKTKAQVHEPVRVKEFCAVVGVPFLRIMKTLQRDHSMLVNINTVLPMDVAELLALDEGVELEIVKAKTPLDELREEYERREPKKLGPRPPVVTFLGHVDHGKTSLLDAIRATRVVAGEDGGITQHLGSYHLKRGELAVTFLDTPGHAAFTAMRARGTQLTDIAVLVVAADDGIMPQTVEAINHAKAANVPIVVAITKIDLGNFNEAQVYGQLAEHDLTPSGDWGGQTDVIKTSAVTSEGIDDLLEHLTALAELLDLQADHTGDATGAVIEAETREGVGAAVRVLVQRGKLSPGAILVCGNSFGKARAILDDQGKRLNSAGPSIPCEIWGLDEVPSAGDQFYVVKSMQRAKSIAEHTRRERVEQARAGTRKARTLEDAFKQRDAEGIPELNVILRADVDGSVDALQHSLEELPKDQVTLQFRHAGVGAVTDSDVLLAQASEAIVIAFRVAPSVSTRRLAEQQGVGIREYRVIYDVIEDISKAMEGLLEPEERLESRATAEVRDVFKVSKVGTVAGCYVTDGLLSRDHRVRLLRDGVVVREQCVIASLRRFKDDAKEVRAGMECGVRLKGFDDVKQGDVIEAYEVVKVARTL